MTEPILDRGVFRCVHRLPLLAGCLALSCASAGIDLDEPQAPSASAASAAATIPDEMPVAPAPTPEPVCPVAADDPAAPLPVPSSAPDDAACFKVPRAVARRVTREFRRAWSLGQERATLAVTRACDRLTPGIAELVIETSNGHGFSLNLHRLRRNEAGDYDLVRLSYGPWGEPYDRDTADHWDNAARSAAKVHTATLPSAMVEAMLVGFRAGLSLRGVEKVPPPRPGSLGIGGSFSMSSRDFHVAYRVLDDNGHGAAAFWVGYAGSTDQAIWIPLDIAADAFRNMMWSDEVEALLTERTPTSDDRDFFAERFSTARDRGPEYGNWYIRERLLGMARTLGDPRQLQDLLALATIQGKHAEARTQIAAVDVLVGITAFDPRYDAKGKARPGPDAAADMLARCGSD